MKWIRTSLLVLFAICLSTTVIVAHPQMARAATTQDITITATGFICGLPSGLTLTYISDREIGISWVPGVGAVNTMIRASIGRYPRNISDGYLLYSGNGTYCSDTGIDLNEVIEGVYYRAWSQNAAGIWTTTSAENWFGDHIVFLGNMVFLLTFLSLAIGLTILAFRTKFAWILFGVIIAWLILTVRCNDLTTVIWDIYYILRVVSVTMIFVTIVFIFSITAATRGKTGTISGEDDIDQYLKEVSQYNNDIDRLRKATRRRTNG